MAIVSQCEEVMQDPRETSFYICMKKSFLCVCVCVCVCVQDLVSLVVASLEKEGVRMMRKCEPRELRGVGGDGEEGRVEVSWYNKTTGEREQVCHDNLYRNRTSQLQCVNTCMIVIMGVYGY